MKVGGLLVAAWLLLAGCISTANYEQVLDTWIGSTETELVAVWGVPARMYDAKDGARVLTYEDSDNLQTPTTATTNVVGGTAYTTIHGGQEVEFSCRTTFVIRSGVVASWSHDGNYCVSF